MTRETLIAELTANGVKFSKLIFKAESPYMKARYKPEFVTWEAWVYSPTFPSGYVITGEDWDESKTTVLEGLK